MTKTYRKLCFYDKKQTRLKMAHVASCRFIYIKTVLPKIAPFLRVSSLCFYFADFLLVVRFFVAGFSSLSFIIASTEPPLATSTGICLKFIKWFNTKLLE